MLVVLPLDVYRDLVVVFAAAYLYRNNCGVVVDRDSTARVFGVVVADDLVRFEIDVEAVFVCFGDAVVDVEAVVTVFLPASNAEFVGWIVPVLFGGVVVESG